MIYGIRRLLRTPLATSLAVLSLAFGIGANSAIFNIYEALVLRPLPVAASSELVAIRSFHPLFGEGRYISYPLYKDLASHISLLSGLAVRSARQFNLNNGGIAERVFGEFVSENYYDLLGVRPTIGRLFTADDQFSTVAVLSYSCWTQKFGSDPHVVGKKIFIDAKPFVVVGVTAREFRGTEIGSQVDIQIPATAVGQILGGQDRLKEPRASWLEAIGRLKPGVSIHAANAEMERVYSGLKDPNIVGPDRLQLISAAKGISPLRSEYSEQLAILLAVTASVLLLTCLNVSSFLFARAFARRQENAIHAAIGARPMALASQPVIESLLLSLFGALLGFAVVLPLANNFVRFFASETVTESLGAAIDWRVFGFGVLAASLSAVAVAAYPAIWMAFSNPAELLKEGGTITGHRGAARLGNGLITAQVAISTILVFGTVLFVRTAQSLETNSTGFSSQNLLFASLDPASSGYNVQQTKQFYTDILDRVRSIPGVLHVGLSRLAPLSSDIDANTICADTYRPAKDEKMEQNVNTISPDYFSAVGIQLLAGRDFSLRDAATSPPVAIVNRRMAQDLFGTSNAIGHRIGIGCDNPSQANIEVVGVVTDARYDSLRDNPARLVYIPYLQNDENLRLTLNAEVSGSTEAMVATIRHQVSTVDPNVPLFQVRTMSEQMDQSLWREHLLARLAGFFSVLALVLCGLGIYSVLTYSIQQRTREIGLRLSLGASRSNVVVLLLRAVLWWILGGLLLGIPVAILVVRSASAVLYGITTLDLGAILATTSIIVVCAVLAVARPASRAMALDPATILRFQ